MKKIIAIFIALLGSVYLFGEEDKPDEIVLKTKTIFVNETISVRLKEDSAIDGYKWYVKTRIADYNYVNLKCTTPFQSSEDEFKVSFSKPNVQFSIYYIYASIKDITKVKHIAHQTYRIVEDVHLKWYTDFEKAREVAKKENKVIMLFFTSSDGCGACRNLDLYHFETKKFEKIANQKLILVDVDFPRKKEQTDEIKRQNYNLKVKYPIKGYPTCYFITPDGEMLGKIVGCKDKFMELMDDILKIKK